MMIFHLFFEYVPLREGAPRYQPLALGRWGSCADLGRLTGCPEKIAKLS